MYFTYPVYITVDTKTRQEGKEEIERMFKIHHLPNSTKKLSYSISNPINSPDTPSCSLPRKSTRKLESDNGLDTKNS